VRNTSPDVRILQENGCGPSQINLVSYRNLAAQSRAVFFSFSIGLKFASIQLPQGPPSPILKSSQFSSKPPFCAPALAAFSANAVLNASRTSLSLYSPQAKTCSRCGFLFVSFSHFPNLHCSESAPHRRVKRVSSIP